MSRTRSGPGNALYLGMPKLWLAIFLVVFTIPRTIFAQGETTSAISGFIADQTGAGISGATVTIVSGENGQKRSLKADDAGRFAFPQLKPGPYDIEVSAPLFQLQRRSAVALAKAPSPVSGPLASV